jgi:CRISPR/Cas system CSM-associated protein Csm3 (group 7 of RAMP superfamily)
MPTMPQTDTRTRVSLSRLTGTARLQALFSSEYGVPALRFDGGITGLLQGVPLIDDDTVTYALLLLLAALGSVEALGGDKSVGVGRVHCEVTHITVNGQARQVSDYLALLPEFETYALAEEEDAAAELAVEEGEKR